MRKPMIAANWKMHKTVEEARMLVWQLLDGGLRDFPQVDRVLCPPFTALLPVSALLAGTDIGLGAQNMHWEEQGAFTGEVAPGMVAEFAQYVILGHSERRGYFGETDEMVQRKVEAALRHDLTPIVCVGETLEQRDAGETEAVVRRQITQGLQGLSQEQAAHLVIAYEPVWAIGTGRAATPKEANRVVGEVIRAALADLYGDEVAQSVRVLYGGSVKPNNAAAFFAQPEIDGALVGGASLHADQFLAIVQAAAETMA